MRWWEKERPPSSGLASRWHGPDVPNKMAQRSAIANTDAHALSKSQRPRYVAAVPLHDPALQYFLAAFESGSINAAARRLYVASSAVSRQIARLELEVGAPLFERHSTGIVATDAAHAFAGFARLAIQNATHIVDEVHQRHSTRAVISIAATDGSGHDFLPRVIADFRTEHPDAQFVLQVAEPKTVTQMIRDGTADLAVTFNLKLDPGVTILYSHQAPLRAVMRRGHPLADTAPLSLADLATYPLALSSPATTNRFLLDACSASQDLPVEPVFVCNNPDALMRFVQHGDAVTLLGQITLRHESDQGDLVTVPLREKEFGQRTLQVQCRAGRNLPKPVSIFTDFLIVALEQSKI